MDNKASSGEDHRGDRGGSRMRRCGNRRRRGSQTSRSRSVGNKPILFTPLPPLVSPLWCELFQRERAIERERNERLAATAAASDILMHTSRLRLGSGLRLLFHLHPKKPQPHSSSSSSYYYYSYSLFSPLSQPYSSSSSSSIYSHLLPNQRDKQQQQQQQQPEKSSRSVGRPRLFRDYDPSLLSHKKSYRDFWSSSSRLESPPPLIPFVRNYSLRVAKIKKTEFDDTSQRAVTTALWCNFLVFSLKFGVWFVTASHVLLAEVVHSVADFANQALLAYGLSSSRRAPDAMHPYGYSKERFVWSLISAVGIFCLGSGATIVHGVQNLWISHPPENIHYAALVIGGSFLIEGASLLVAINAVKKGAAAEGMKVWDYVWRGHDPTSVAVMTEDGAAVTGLVIAAASLVAVNTTGNAIYDPIGSIIVGNLLGMVAIFLIQRNRHALIGRAIDDHDMERVLNFLKSDPVVDALYDCKSEVIGPGFFRFKAEIDFNGVVVVQNYLERTGREEWAKQFQEAAKCEDDSALLKVMACYGEGVVEALGSEVDRLESEIQKIVPGIRHVDIEAHNPETLAVK